MVVHPTTIPYGRVPDKDAVAQCRAAIIVVHSTTVRVRNIVGGTVGISGGDDKAIENGTFVTITAADHVVAVFGSP